MREPLMGPEMAASGNLESLRPQSMVDQTLQASSLIARPRINWSSKCGVVVPESEAWKLKMHKRMNPGLFPGDPDLED